MIIKLSNIHFDSYSDICIYSDKCVIYTKYLIIYIQYEFFKAYPNYGLSPEQLANILSDLYGFMKIEKENVKEDFMIDTFLTWEELCMAASFIENIKLFEKKMLNSILKKCYLEIITQNC